MYSSDIMNERFLLIRLKHDDKQVFEIIFRFYYTGLVVYADKIIRDTEISEDIVQSVFMKLWEERKNLNIDSLRSYLGTAVRNKSIDWIRNRRVKDKYREYVLESDQEPGDDFYTFQELSEMISQAVDKLPPRCREIFLMSRSQHLKIEEIAAKLNLSKRTVETHISHALKILRVELKDYFYLVLIFSGTWVK